MCGEVDLVAMRVVYTGDRAHPVDVDQAHELAGERLMVVAHDHGDVPAGREPTHQGFE
jgi:hypothetical protein